MPLMWRVRPGDAKAVKLPGTDPFEPDVPDIARFVPRWVEDDGARRRIVFGTIEQVEADARCVPAEDGEVDAVPSHVRSKGNRRTRSDGLNLTQLEQPFQFVELLGASRFFGHRQDAGQSRAEWE